VRRIRWGRAGGQLGAGPACCQPCCRPAGLPASLAFRAHASGAAVADQLTQHISCRHAPQGWRARVHGHHGRAQDCACMGGFSGCLLLVTALSLCWLDGAGRLHCCAWHCPGPRSLAECRHSGIPTCAAQAAQANNGFATASPSPCAAQPAANARHSAAIHARRIVPRLGDNAPAGEMIQAPCFLHEVARSSSACEMASRRKATAPTTDGSEIIDVEQGEAAMFDAHAGHICQKLAPEGPASHGTRLATLPGCEQAHLRHSEDEHRQALPNLGAAAPLEGGDCGTCKTA
jgi:hypothetical protein